MFLTIAVQVQYLYSSDSYHYTPYSTRMSSETMHKLMGFYMEVFILGVIL